jgi:hypothetical protein
MSFCGQHDEECLEAKMSLHTLRRRVDPRDMVSKSDPESSKRAIPPGWSSLTEVYLIARLELDSCHPKGMHRRT